MIIGSIDTLKAVRGKILKRLFFIERQKL